MNFLEMAQMVRQEVGGSGTGPTTVVGQTGEYKRIVDWVAQADRDVQRRHNEWKFMRGSFTINTVANDPSYAYGDTTPAITTFRDWRWTTFKIRLASSGLGSETELPFIDYQTYLDINVGNQSASMPQCFTVGNAMEILLWPKPDNVYVITGEYQKSSVAMTANADTPVYPEEYHMLAVYKAREKYGIYTGAQEQISFGKQEYKNMLKEMRRTQLPRIQLGDPLV